MSDAKTLEIDVFEFTGRGEDIPHAPVYVVRIDGHPFRIETEYPTGEFLLSKVNKRPCAFELIEELAHGKNNVVEASETVDLRKRGLKGFITAHKDLVTIFIGGLDKPFTIERGERTVQEILSKVGQSSDGYVLYEEKDGQPPMPLPDNKPVRIEGCELFHSQAKSGGSS